MRFLLPVALVLAAIGVVGWIVHSGAPDPGPGEVDLTLTPASGELGADWITTHFSEDALVGAVTVVGCTLSDGTESECFHFTTVQAPRVETVGPWCPTNVADTGEEAGGMWLRDGAVHEVDGAFVANLSAFYEDDRWRLYDEATGEIHVTDTREACEAAARPDVDEAYENYCVECQVTYLEELPEVTYVIPAHPSVAPSARALRRDGAGIAFNGVRFDGPAPVDAILAAHTLAPFDDCGGHVNLHVGYNNHAATDCPDRVSVGGSHAPVIGLALDGYAIHARTNDDGLVPGDLDECGGHSTEELGYHYHAGEEGSNAILACHRGATGCVLRDADGVCDASADTRGPPPPGAGRPGRPSPEPGDGR